jgi:hypothetical protein
MNSPTFHNPQYQYWSAVELKAAVEALPPSAFGDIAGSLRSGAAALRSAVVAFDAAWASAERCWQGSDAAAAQDSARTISEWVSRLADLSERTGQGAAAVQRAVVEAKAAMPARVIDGGRPGGVPASPARQVAAQQQQLQATRAVQALAGSAVQAQLIAPERSSWPAPLRGQPASGPVFTASGPLGAGPPSERHSSQVADPVSGAGGPPTERSAAPARGPSSGTGAPADEFGWGEPGVDEGVTAEPDGSFSTPIGRWPPWTFAGIGVAGAAGAAAGYGLLGSSTARSWTNRGTIAARASSPVGTDTFSTVRAERMVTGRRGAGDAAKSRSRAGASTVRPVGAEAEPPRLPLLTGVAGRRTTEDRESDRPRYLVEVEDYFGGPGELVAPAVLGEGEALR